MPTIETARKGRTSVGRLVAIKQLATYSSLAKAPNYLDCGAPPIKFSFLRFSVVIPC
jgi:hypothetical protein